jgi:hypothetical protein
MEPLLALPSLEALIRFSAFFALMIGGGTLALTRNENGGGQKLIAGGVILLIGSFLFGNLLTPKPTEILALEVLGSQIQELGAEISASDAQVIEEYNAEVEALKAELTSASAQSWDEDIHARISSLPTAVVQDKFISDTALSALPPQTTDGTSSSDLRAFAPGFLILTFLMALALVAALSGIETYISGFLQKRKNS